MSGNPLEIDLWLQYAEKDAISAFDAALNSVLKRPYVYFDQLNVLLAGTD
jgi:hypothetical protein